MLVLSHARLRGGGWSSGRSHKYTEVSKSVSCDKRPVTVLEDLRKFAKRWDISKRTFHFSYYEHPTLKRARQAGERAYFSKWHYLKYCAQVVQHAIKHKLPMGTPFEQHDEMRLLKPVPINRPDPKRDAMNTNQILQMARGFYGNKLCDSITTNGEFK